jgi:hypothetical protein
MFLDRAHRGAHAPAAGYHRQRRRLAWAALLSLSLLLPVYGAQAGPVAAGTCTRTVTSATALRSAISAASAGWTICFGGNITTGSRIEIKSKSGIIIDGRGYTLKGSGYFSVLYLQCAVDTKVRDLKIVGSHASPGVYIAGKEHAHGIHVDGGRRLRFFRLDIQKNQGDGLYVGKCGTKSWADDVTIADSRIGANGRHGIAVVAGRNVKAFRMRYHDIAYHMIDIEPDWNAGYQQGATDLRFEGATSVGWIGRFPSGLVDAAAFYIGTPYGAQSGKYKPVIARVKITDHTVWDGITGLRTQLETRGGYRITDVTLTNSVGKRTVAGIPAGYGWVQAADVDRLTVTYNSQPVKSGAYVVKATRSTGLVVKGNTGAGLKGQIAP